MGLATDRTQDARGSLLNSIEDPWQPPLQQSGHSGSMMIDIESLLSNSSSATPIDAGNNTVQPVDLHNLIPATDGYQGAQLSNNMKNINLTDRDPAVFRQNNGQVLSYSQLSSPSPPPLQSTSSLPSSSYSQSPSPTPLSSPSPSSLSPSSSAVQSSSRSHSSSSSLSSTPSSSSPSESQSNSQIQTHTHGRSDSELRSHSVDGSLSPKTRSSGVDEALKSKTSMKSRAEIRRARAARNRSSARRSRLRKKAESERDKEKAELVEKRNIALKEEVKELHEKMIALQRVVDSLGFTKTESTK